MRGAFSGIISGKFVDGVVQAEQSLSYIDDRELKVFPDEVSSAHGSEEGVYMRSGGCCRRLLLTKVFG